MGSLGMSSWSGLIVPEHCKAKVLFVATAPLEGEREPLTGAAGRELDRVFKLAGLVRKDHAFTTVFDRPIPGNDLENITVATVEKNAKVKEGEWADYDVPAIKRGRWLLPEWDPRARLADEIKRVNPNLLVPLGDEALWAVTGESGIGKVRGALGMAEAPWLDRAYKMLPSYHPAFIMRNYSQRVVLIADMMKVVREMESPELHLPTRELWIEPTLEDIRAFKRDYLDPADLISVDIETAAGQIDCIAFSPSPYLSLCVPFTDTKGRWNYWPTLEEEQAAWRLVRDILRSPTPKLLQNGLYDVYWLYVKYKIKVRNYLHDTRLLHHALYPELPKSLDFMVSLHANERAWKLLNEKKSTKRDD